MCMCSYIIKSTCINTQPTCWLAVSSCIFGWLFGLAFTWALTTDIDIGEWRDSIARSCQSPTCRSLICSLGVGWILNSAIRHVAWVPLFLGQNAPNALHLFGPFVTDHITCYGEGKWLRFLAIGSISAKKKWQSTPHVLICGFKSNGISMMTGWCCWKFTYISWNHQKGRPLHICTTIIWWYQEMFGLVHS